MKKKTVRFEIVAHVEGENILDAYFDLCTLFKNKKAEVLVVNGVRKVNSDETAVKRAPTVDLDSF